MYLLSITILFTSVILTSAFSYTNFLRSNRRCDHHRSDQLAFAGVIPVESNRFALTLFFLIGVLLLLLALGFLKAILGLFCWNEVGSFGLENLIDLPVPLSRYQEKHLEGRPVLYDVAGYPVHPDTLKKSVKFLPKRTEFCLNLIFFLAYPLVGIFYICSLGCCINNMRQISQTCFRKVNIIKVSKKIPEDKSKLLSSRDQELQKEEQDTKYVINALEKSKESIQEMQINMKSLSTHEKQ